MSRGWVPPHDLDVEAAALGAAMLTVAARDLLFASLFAEDFYAPKHQAIFRAIAAVHFRGEAVDPLTVARELRGEGGDEHAGAKEELLRLAASTGIHHGEYVRIVAELAARRRLIALAERVRDDACGDRPVDEIVAELEHVADKVRLPMVDIEPAESALTLATRTRDVQYRWLVPDWIERQDRVALTGAEGVGKSTLMRQWAVQLASGIHPWNLTAMHRVSTLYIDLQDTPQQAGRAFSRLIAIAGARYDDSKLHVVCWRAGIDLRDRRDYRRVDRLMEIHKPDVLMLGPHYKCYRLAKGEKSSDEGPAIETANALDAVLARHDAALVIEMHSPHGENNDRAQGRPYGPSLWLRWPEFGIWLHHPKGQPDVLVADRWRGDRDRARGFPGRFTSSGRWPWSALLKEGA